MFSTLTIISIFTEIFLAGILISGGLTFLRNSLFARRWRDLFFGLFLLDLFVYVAAALAFTVDVQSRPPAGRIDPGAEDRFRQPGGRLAFSSGSLSSKNSEYAGAPGLAPRPGG